MGRSEGSAGIPIHKEKPLIGSKGVELYFFAKINKNKLAGRGTGH